MHHIHSLRSFAAAVVAATLCLASSFAQGATIERKLTRLTGLWHETLEDGTKIELMLMKDERPGLLASGKWQASNGEAETFSIVVSGGQEFLRLRSGADSDRVYMHVPTQNDALRFVRLAARTEEDGESLGAEEIVLARSATGQSLSVRVTKHERFCTPQAGGESWQCDVKHAATYRLKMR